VKLFRIEYLLLSFVLSFAVGCSKSSNNPLSSDSDQKEFITGAPAVYSVSGAAGTAVVDSVTGSTFQFPEGAGGTLTIAPVTAGPSTSFQAKKFSVEYSGAESIQVSVPCKTGEKIALYSYGSIGKAAIDGCGLMGWWGIPSIADSSGYVVFNVLSPSQLSALKRAGFSQAQQKEYYAISTISGGTDVAANIEAIKTTTRQIVDQWLNNLPSSLYTNALNRINGSLQYTLAFKDDGNAYMGNNSMVWSNAVFEFNPYSGEKKADLAIIAHEVGHYMTHVLTGYPRYSEILNRITDWEAYADHGLAVYREGRKDLLEEYAYFSTYMITGDLNGTDLKKVNFRTFFQSRTPDSCDYPSQEGYGAALLGVLMKTDGEIYSFDKNTPKVKVPTVGASLSDILGILAKGPRDVNEMRSFIQDYLDSRGNEDRFKLPALFEPAGWSYNGTGAVVDKSNKPVKGAHVQSICQDGAKEYRTFMSTATGDDGSYLLPRIYPGTNVLRLFWNGDKDSTDVSFTADWTKPTNVSLKMGTFTIDNSPALKTYTLTRTTSPKNVAWGGDTAESYDIAAKITATATLTATGPGLEVTEDGSYLRVPMNIPISVSVAVTYTKTIVNATNPYGAIFTVGEPVFDPKWPGSLTAYGPTVTDKRTATTMACDFTLTSSGDAFNLVMYATVPFQVSGYENDKLEVWTDTQVLIGGPGFSFLPKN